MQNIAKMADPAPEESLFLFLKNICFLGELFYRAGNIACWVCPPWEAYSRLVYPRIE